MGAESHFQTKEGMQVFNNIIVHPFPVSMYLRDWMDMIESLSSMAQHDLSVGGIRPRTQLCKPIPHCSNTAALPTVTARLCLVHWVAVLSIISIACRCGMAVAGSG